MCVFVCFLLVYSTVPGLDRGLCFGAYLSACEYICLVVMLRFANKKRYEEPETGINIDVRFGMMERFNMYNFSLNQMFSMAFKPGILFSVSLLDLVVACRYNL